MGRILPLGFLGLTALAITGVVAWPRIPVAAPPPAPLPSAPPALEDRPAACPTARLKARLEAGEPFDLVFVGSREFFEQRRIPGASWVPYPELAESFSRRDRNREVVVYCGCCAGASEGISGAAVRLLRSLGFHRISHLEGHFAAWQSAGFPVEGTNPGTPNPEKAYATLEQKERLERFAALQDSRRRELELALRAEADDDRRRRIFADLQKMDREGEREALNLKRAIAVENGDRSKVEDIDRILATLESP